MRGNNPADDVVPVPGRAALPVLVAGGAFLALFGRPMVDTAELWWRSPDAGHGLLLAPVAVYLAWRRGLVPAVRPQVLLGSSILIASILVRYLSGLAAELFTMRLSVLGAAAGLVIFCFGIRQVLHWWLPAVLLLLAVPLPEIVLGSLALPLQFKASEMGAALLTWRHVPVELAGNVIHLPSDHRLFVTEACSGLRSLSALLALSLLIGELWLRTPVMRVLLVVLAVPVAMALNAVRIFGTGFLVYFVDERLGEGLMHYTEGWVLFAAALMLLGAVAWALLTMEQWWAVRRPAAEVVA